MLRYRRTRRLRIITCAVLLLLLTGAPLLLGFTRPKPGMPGEVPGMFPGVFDAYASGFNSLGVAALVALPLAVVFVLWVMTGDRKQVNRKYLHGGVRARVNLVASLRTLAIVIGAAGLIVGSLAGFYAALIAARPDLAYDLPLQFFTFELALGCMLGGGALYALGRFGR